MKNNIIRKEFSALSFGEVMMRLSPEGKERVGKSDTFLKHAGGSELNVVSGISDLGLRTGIITKLPDNVVGNYVQNQIRGSGVSDDYVLKDARPDSRLGLFYYESGAHPRKPHVLYDRKNSAFTTFDFSELPEDIFSKTNLFHTSGITLALGKTPQNTAVRLMKAMKKAGAIISFDVNFRANLWSEEEARSCIESILPYVDILFVSEETSRRMFNRKGSLKEIMKSYTLDYGISVVASTQREVISHSKHNFNSILYESKNNNYYTDTMYENIEVIDRIGSGDAYVSGVLYTILSNGEFQEAVEFGNAMSALKNTVDGDLVGTNFKEIVSIIKTHKSNVSGSEMDR